MQLQDQHQLHKEDPISYTPGKYHYTEKEISNISSLVTVLKQIRARVLREGGDTSRDYQEQITAVLRSNK